MLEIVACEECTQISYCKIKPDFKEEIELLLAIKNKFDNAIVQVNCHCFHRGKLPTKIVEA